MFLTKFCCDQPKKSMFASCCCWCFINPAKKSTPCLDVEFLPLGKNGISLYKPQTGRKFGGFCKLTTRDCWKMGKTPEESEADWIKEHMGIYSSNRGLVVDMLGNYQRVSVKCFTSRFSSGRLGWDPSTTRRPNGRHGVRKGRLTDQVNVWKEMRLPDPAWSLPVGSLMCWRSKKQSDWHMCCFKPIFV